MTFQDLLNSCKAYRAGVESSPHTGNWFGVSAHAPDWQFTRPGVRITLSLQGIFTPYAKEFDALFHAVAVKYIRIETPQGKAWETWTGELPPQSLIDALPC